MEELFYSITAGDLCTYLSCTECQALYKNVQGCPRDAFKKKVSDKVDFVKKVIERTESHKELWFNITDDEFLDIIMEAIGERTTGDG